MSRRPRLSDHELRALLRAGDPAYQAPPLEPAERAAIRIALEGATPRRRVAHPPFRWAAAGALIVLGAVAATLLRAPGGDGTAPETPIANAAVTTRQLDFKTPGGTRLIWVFDAPGPKENP
jgi:hypothetical protein